MNVIVNIQGNLVLEFPVSPVEANAIQNAANREMGALAEPVTGIKEKVAMYFYQARNDPKSATGDRVIIESISSRPVKAVFRNEATKVRLLARDENLFHSAYVVDVAVETVRDRVAMYRVLEVHDIIELPQLSSSDDPPLLGS